MKTLTPWRRSRGAALATILLTAATGAGAQQATTQYGELDFGTRQYYPQGCTHSGNTAVCTFVFVQQGQTQPIHVGWNGELAGIQFVDDSHVPHNPSNAYFVDNYGGRQTNMTVNRGDQGTMMIEFAQVDPQVGSGGFTMGQQALSGIPVGQGGGGQLAGANSLAGMGGAPAGSAAPAATRPGAPALAAPNTINASKLAPSANTRVAAAAPAQAQANQAAPAPGCNTPQTMNTPACKLNNKINNAQNNAANTIGAVAAPVSAVQQLGSSISSLFKKPAAAPAAAPAPVQQPASQ